MLSRGNFSTDNSIVTAFCHVVPGGLVIVPHHVELLHCRWWSTAWNSVFSLHFNWKKETSFTTYHSCSRLGRTFQIAATGFFQAGCPSYFPANSQNTWEKKTVQKISEA